MNLTIHPHIAISQNNGKNRIDFRKQADPVQKIFFSIFFIVLSWALFVWVPKTGQDLFDIRYIKFIFFVYLIIFILFGKRVVFPKKRWITIDESEIVFGYKSLFRKVERTFNKAEIQELKHSKEPMSLTSSFSIDFIYHKTFYSYSYFLQRSEANEILELMGNNKSASKF